MMTECEEGTKQRVTETFQKLGPASRKRSVVFCHPVLQVRNDAVIVL